jgi:hypothetical protein
MIRPFYQYLMPVTGLPNVHFMGLMYDEYGLGFPCDGNLRNIRFYFDDGDPSNTITETDPAELEIKDPIARHLFVIMMERLLKSFSEKETDKSVTGKSRSRSSIF